MQDNPLIVVSHSSIMQLTKEAEQNVDPARESVEFQRLVLENTRDLIRLFCPAGQLIHANPLVKRLMGEVPSDFSGFPHPDELEASLNWFERLFEGGMDLLHWRVRTVDGEWRWMEMQGTVVLYQGTRHILTNCRDVTELKRAEDALRKSESLFRQVLDALPVGVGIVDPAGDILMSNPSARRIWGNVIVSGADRYAESKGWWHDTGKQIQPDEWFSVTALTEGKTTVNEVIEIENSEGLRKIIEASAAPVRDGMGGITSAVVIINDITHRRRAEEALLESERRLNEAQRIAHIGHWEWDMGTDRIRASDETHHIFGLVPQENLKNWSSWQALVHPEDRAKRAEATDRARREGSRFEAEYRAIRPDGDIRIIRSEGEVMRDRTGQVCGLFGIIRDITDYRRADEARRAAELRLEHVVASSPAVLFSLQVENGQARPISWMSENVGAMLGYRVEETPGADWWLGNIHADDREAVIAQFLSEIFSRGYSTAEYRFRHKDGRYRWIRGEAQLLRDARGEPTEVVGSMSDITERKRLEEQFRQVQKMEAVGHLAGGVAHDFNNLLAIIFGYGDLLLPQFPPIDPRREMIFQILQAGERAADLTRQLLAFSRQTVLDPKILDLNELVHENEKMLRRLIGEDVQLTTVLDPALPRVKVDPGQISQVIMNFAINARDAMPTGGKLTIETSHVQLDEASVAAIDPEAKPGRYALLAVTDTGTGISPEVRVHIFEPFFTTKGPGKGTGLGLATVYGIVKQSGGAISVQSEAGEGTTFKIHLPIVDGPVPTMKASQGPNPPVEGTETILLVEDEEAVRTVVRIVLEESGYTVLVAGRGAEALELCDRHSTSPIHLLITDVVMPDIGGRQLVERMSKLRPDIKVLYLSGYTDDEVVRYGVQQAEVAFLQKPFTVVALTNKVREILDA